MSDTIQIKDLPIINSVDENDLLLIQTYNTGVNRSITRKDFVGNFATKSDIQDAILEKVDKDGTKVLSDENFTTDYKTKLESLENFSKDYNDLTNTPDLSIYEDGINQNVENIKTIQEQLVDIEQDIVDINANKQDIIVDDGWVSLTLTSGSSPTEAPISVRKVGNVIYLSGRITGLTDFGVFSTLDEKYRHTLYQPNYICGDVSSNKTYKISINSNGEMSLVSTSTDTIEASDVIDISNISFII